MGQLVDGIDRAHQRGKRQQVEQAGAFDPLDRKQHGQTEKTEHHQILHPVVAGQHGAQLAIPGMKLDQRVQRYDEQAAGDSQQQKVDDEQSVGADLRQEKERRDYAQCAERHQAGFDVVFGSLARKQRADDDADAGAGHQPLNNDGIGQCQALFGEGGKGGQHHLRDPPEYRQTDNREPDDAVIQQLAEVAAQVAAAAVVLPLETAIRRLGRGGLELQRQQKLQQRTNDQHPTERCDRLQHLGFAAVSHTCQALLKQYGEDKNTGENRDDGDCLHCGIGGGQPLFPGQLLDIAVLRR